MLICMENYCNFDRNRYLHKHNIIEPEVVERIKNNTLLICYWLLGAIRMTGNLNTDKRTLGIIDFSFDKLFKKIAYRNRYKYLLDLSDGVVRKGIRNFSMPPYFFDQNGILQDAELIFLEFEEYPADFVRYRLYLNECSDFINKIVVNRKHIPKKIWWFKEDGSKEIIYNGE